MQNYIDHALDKINEIENNPYPMPDSWMEVNGYLLLALVSGMSDLITIIEERVNKLEALARQDDSLENIKATMSDPSPGEVTEIHPLRDLEAEVRAEMEKK